MACPEPEPDQPEGPKALTEVLLGEMPKELPECLGPDPEAARRSYEMVGMEQDLALDAGSAYSTWMQISSDADEQQRREWQDIGIERTGGGSLEMDVRQMRSEAQRLEYQMHAMEDMHGDASSDEESCELESLKGRRQELIYTQ